MSKETTEFGEQATQRLQRVIQQMADFIALYESASEKIESFEESLHMATEESRMIFQEQLASIKGALNDTQRSISELSGILSPIGHARWRERTEELLKQGHEHIHSIKEATESFKSTAKRMLDRLDQVSVHAANRITDATTSFNINDLKSLASRETSKITKAGESTERRINTRLFKFFMQNAVAGFVAAIVVSFLMGYFMTGEWPWEGHEKVVAEREAGRTLIRAWPLLNDNERERIKKAASTYM